MSLRLFLR